METREKLLRKAQQIPLPVTSIVSASCDKEMASFLLGGPSSSTIEAEEDYYDDDVEDEDEADEELNEVANILIGFSNQTASTFSTHLSRQRHGHLAPRDTNDLPSRDEEDEDEEDEDNKMANILIMLKD